MKSPQVELVSSRGKIVFGGGAPLALIAGPCVIESEAHVDFLARELSQLAGPFIFKASFDKANRSSVGSYRGPGLEEGLRILGRVRAAGIPVLTDIHEAWQAEVVAERVDILQIPAFLCRQTDLLVAAGKTGKIVNVKKGQFLAPWDMENVAKKISASGNDNIMLCERGASFGYNTLVSDMRAIPIMARTGYPVIFDATHSVQQPGGNGTSSGGDRTMVPVLARAALAVGVAGIFMETHQDPDNAPSDGPNMVKLADVSHLLEIFKKFDALSKDSPLA